MKTVVISGASRGIGLATAEKFLEEGYEVIGTSTSGKIKIEHENFHKLQLDLSKPDSIKKATAKIKKIFPKINVLVNNAGVLFDADENLSIKNLRKTLEVNLIGTVDFTERLLGLIIKNGSVVNVSSVEGVLSDELLWEGSQAYKISKAALNMYTKIMALKLRNKNITVSALDPGWVKTDMGNIVADETYGPDREPEEVAEEIFWLATRKVKTGKFWKEKKPRSW